jgi:hypothetical protein
MRSNHLRRREWQVPLPFSQVLAFDIRRAQLQFRCFLATGTLCSEAMSLPTEVLRHARLFASARASDGAGERF